MRKTTRFLSLLALLMTAATGAWAQTGMTNGLFSVSATKKVYFSKGNLQLVGENTFQFAENQWDYFGNNQSDNHRDLFCWGTGNNPNQTTGNSTFTDWGDNTYLQATLGKGWRTMTKDEFVYVFNTRASGSRVFDKADGRYTLATIDPDGTGVKGIILFPDGITIEASEVKTPGTINGTGTVTQCTKAQWAALAEKGCVFLPAGGFILSGTGLGHGDIADYWTSTAADASKAYNLGLNFGVPGAVVNPAGTLGYNYGLSVRLVIDSNAIYSVALNDGSDNPTTWTGKVGEATTFSALPLEGVAEGQTVTLKYSGDRQVKSVTATTDAGPAGPKAAKDATAEDLGKVIGADGNIYDDADAATAANTTAVAKIFYVGSDNGEDAPYNHGLALALGDVSDTKTWCSQEEATCLGTGHQFDSKAGAKGDMAGIDNTDALVNNTGHTHDAASAARNYNSGTHPAGTSAWFLPSAGQWDKMATAAGSYANLINNAGLQGGDAAYWSSTEGGADYAWLFDSSNGDLNTYAKDYDFRVRACLAF